MTWKIEAVNVKEERKKNLPRQGFEVTFEPEKRNGTKVKINCRRKKAMQFRFSWKGAKDEEKAKTHLCPAKSELELSLPARDVVFIQWKLAQ